MKRVTTASISRSPLDRCTRASANIIKHIVKVMLRIGVAKSILGFFARCEYATIKAEEIPRGAKKKTEKSSESRIEVVTVISVVPRAVKIKSKRITQVGTAQTVTPTLIAFSYAFFIVPLLESNGKVAFYPRISSDASICS